MINKEPAESHICIFADNITVKARIGLFASEAKPQGLAVSVALYAAPAYLKGVTDDNIIDYKKIYDTVQAWQGREHVKLVETYLRELLDLAFSFNDVIAARVSVSKTEIFPHADGAGAGAYMTRDDYKKI